MACSLHLINSVGQSGKDEKNAAKKPALAFSTSDNCLMDSLPETLATSFWHQPYAGMIRIPHNDLI